MTPPPPFLRSATVTLTPLDEADNRLLVGHPHLPPGEDEILLIARDPQGDPLALCGLSPIDWTRREATLFCSPATGGSHVAETVRLLTTYALDELALELLFLHPALDGNTLREYTSTRDGYRLKRPLP